MTPNRRLAACIVGLALTGAGVAGHVASATGAAAFPDDNRAIVHVLNRIGFGPRPGDVEKVHALGLQKYIEQQLRPDRIPDAGMSAHLATLSTLNMSSRDIAEQFELPLLEARRAQKDAAVGSAGSAGNGAADDPK